LPRNLRTPLTESAVRSFSVRAVSRQGPLDIIPAHSLALVAEISADQRRRDQRPKRRRIDRAESRPDRGASQRSPSRKFGRTRHSFAHPEPPPPCRIAWRPGRGRPNRALQPREGKSTNLCALRRQKLIFGADRQEAASSLTAS